MSPLLASVAQDAIAGSGVGISHELISLEVTSPEVPDLTLIDLPGITRVAVGNQPQDIGLQVRLPGTWEWTVLSRGDVPGPCRQPQGSAGPALTPSGGGGVWRLGPQTQDLAGRGNRRGGLVGVEMDRRIHTLPDLVLWPCQPSVTPKLSSDLEVARNWIFA